MTTIDARTAGAAEPIPGSQYKHAPHFRTELEEFDACKIGMWLFLATEVLLFAGLFVAYGIYRMKYPEAFSLGSGYLDWRWGGLNTIVLLVSSYTIAMAVRNAQMNQQGLLKFNLIFTWVCAAAFIIIKLTFEYIPKWSEGKRPGVWFDYPFALHPQEPTWWGVYYCATGIHATHVLIGMALIGWLVVRTYRKQYGPNHYAGIEIVALYWHIVDLIWIFLFPLLYLIH